MSAFCWFAVFNRLPQPPDEAFLLATPGVSGVLVHTPAETHDPYLGDGPPPPLALQIYFPDIGSLEAALIPGGHLARLAELMPGAEAVQQAMLVRRFPVPDPVFRVAPGMRHCTYLVAYEGDAEDIDAWLGHYVASHPPIMARFPGVRAIEVYSRLDWLGALPWPRSNAMQRNKVVFDSPDALTAALNSHVRHEMREDFAHFPPCSGPNTHHPMATRALS